MHTKHLKNLALLGMITLAGVSLGNPAYGQTPISLSDLRTTALSQHNTYRTTHHVSGLTLDTSSDTNTNTNLNTIAQNWAQYLAANQLFQHSSASQRNNAGENLYVYYTTASSIPATQLATQAVQSWYGEIKDYDYKNPGFSSKTGHFTQVVWKSSTTLGCGAAQGKVVNNGTTFNAFYVVCNYAPGGNILGQFPANVIQP